MKNMESFYLKNRLGMKNLKMKKYDDTPEKTINNRIDMKLTSCGYIPSDENILIREFKADKLIKQKGKKLISEEIAGCLPLEVIDRKGELYNLTEDGYIKNKDLHGKYIFFSFERNDPITTTLNEDRRRKMYEKSKNFT